jgi:hypothetical protein
VALKTAATPAAEKVWRAVAGGAALQTALSYFLSWWQRLGKRRRYSVLAKPFAGDDHPPGMPFPSSERSTQNPNIRYLLSDLPS